MARKTILVVDDDAGLRKMMVRMLDKEGYAPRQADCTADAAGFLRAGAIDGVLLDVMLDQENGWETLRLLREFSDVPILLMTGANVDEETLRDARMLGAQGMIRKPFEFADLASILARVLKEYVPGKTQRQNPGGAGR